ncbi:MAG: signal peptidase I [Sphingomonadales bacterium]
MNKASDEAVKSEKKTLKPKPVQEKESWQETVMVIVSAVFIALLLRVIAYEPFNIPSESMLPNLLTGDHIFVSKYPYGYSKHSIPFFSMGGFDGRILESPVKRGDAVVFKLPRDNETDYIKRVVGLPGDRMQMKSGFLYINGDKVKKERVSDFVVSESENTDCRDIPQYRFRKVDNIVQCRYPQYKETLPNGVSYLTLDLLPNGPSDNTGVYTVPQGHYFAMGDNRDNSSDSRKPISLGVGYIPSKNLVGRAEIIFFSVNGNSELWELWKWPKGLRATRFFKSLRPNEN